MNKNIYLKNTNSSRTKQHDSKSKNSRDVTQPPSDVPDDLVQHSLPPFRLPGTWRSLPHPKPSNLLTVSTRALISDKRQNCHARFCRAVPLPLSFANMIVKINQISYRDGVVGTVRDGSVSWEVSCRQVKKNIGMLRCP
jgi:hypothetical protein